MDYPVSEFSEVYPIQSARSRVINGLRWDSPPALFKVNGILSTEFDQVMFTTTSLVSFALRD